MGKMISLQSISVAAAATGMPASDEARLFGFTLKHSVFLACINRARGLCIRLRMRTPGFSDKSRCHVVCVCAMQRCRSSRAFNVVGAGLGCLRYPPLPATAEAAYRQWSDVSGVLTPNAISQKVTTRHQEAKS